MIKIGGIANPDKPEMDKFLEGVIGVVEASNFEHYSLWLHNDQRTDERKKLWKSGGGGPMVQVGVVTSGEIELPVCCALLVDEVDGHRILFVEVTSRGVDHDLVRKWLEDNMPVTAFEDSNPRKRLNITDANNFHNVFPPAWPVTPLAWTLQNRIMIRTS